MSSRRPWTQADIDTAVAMARAGRSARQVAAETGRTVVAVKDKLRKLRVPLIQWKRLPDNAWTAEDDARAIEWLHAGWTLVSIGDELHRTEAAVSAHLKRLGIKVVPGRKLVNKRSYVFTTGTPRHEPTDAELDALIAAQRRNLPPWWAEECAKQAEEDHELDVLTGHTIPTFVVTSRHNGRMLSAKVI